MKKFLLLSVFLLTGLFSNAQLHKTDVTEFLTKGDITTGELWILNVYYWEKTNNNKVYPTTKGYLQISLL